MRTGRISLVMTACRRCGKPITTGSRSLYGADEAKAKLDRICEICITPDERQAILAAQAVAITALVR